MQLEDRDPAYLWDMLQAAQEVKVMLSDCEQSEFLANRMLTLAVERSVQIIGEAARRVSTPFQAAHPEIPWREIIGQRNILAHEYGRINHEQLFKTAAEDIPELIERLQHILPPIDNNK